MTSDELGKWIMDQYIEDYNNYLCNLWNKLKQNMLEEELAEYINEGVSEYLLQYKDKANLYFHDFTEVHDDYVVSEFYGGLNGCGEWEDYLKVISKLVTLFNVRYHCWLISLVNDCPDDVFYLKLGIKYKNDTCRSI